MEGKWVPRYLSRLILESVCVGRGGAGVDCDARKRVRMLAFRERVRIVVEHVNEGDNGGWGCEEEDG